MKQINSMFMGHMKDDKTAHELHPAIIASLHLAQKVMHCYYVKIHNTTAYSIAMGTYLLDWYPLTDSAL